MKWFFNLIVIMVAVLLSWSSNQSVAWAILHGFLAPFYIIYWLCANGVDQFLPALGFVR